MLTLGLTIIISPLLPSSTSFSFSSTIFTTDVFMANPIGKLPSLSSISLVISFIETATVASVGPYPFIILVCGNLFISSEHNVFGNTSPINTIAFKLGSISQLKLSSTTHIPANEGVDTQRFISESLISLNISFKFESVFLENP